MLSLFLAVLYFFKKRKRKKTDLEKENILSLFFFSLGYIKNKQSLNSNEKQLYIQISFGQNLIKQNSMT